MLYQLSYTPSVPDKGQRAVSMPVGATLARGGRMPDAHGHFKGRLPSSRANGTVFVRTAGR